MIWWSDLAIFQINVAAAVGSVTWYKTKGFMEILGKIHIYITVQWEPQNYRVHGNISQDKYMYCSAVEPTKLQGSWKY